MPHHKYKSTPRNSYDQFVPSYANESYDSYEEMRSGYGGSPARGRDRSPPRAPRDRGFEFTSDRVHPREAKLDSRDSRDRDRGRDRSRSPPRHPSSRPFHDDRRSSYQRPAQQSPRPSPLGNNGASASSRRPPNDIPKLVRHDSSPSIQQTPKESPSSAPSVPVQSVVTVPSVPTTVPPAAPTEVHLAIAQTLGGIFKQFGEEAANTALLKQQKAAAEKELKKKRDDYSKGKSNHGKFPASEEAQRKARDYAERQLIAVNKKLKEKDDSLIEIATSAASKIPNILGATSGGASTEEHQKMRQNCEDLAKRCNNLQQQLEDQKKQMDDERKAREQLEQKHSELVSQYRTTQSQVGEAKTLQSKFEGDIRSQLKKEAIDTQKEIQDLKRDAASALSDLSRVPPNLQQTLQRFDDLFKRLNGLPNVEAELQKIRGEITENSNNLNGQFTPLIKGLDQAKSDIAEHAKHIIDTANEQSVFQDKLKDWKKGIDASVSAVNKSSKQEYISKQDFIALKQEVTRIGSKPTTPPADLPLNPNILVALQDLQARVQTLEKQFGALNLSKVENRLSACEENGKTYVKAYKFSEALDEVADMKNTINSMNGKWASLNEKVDKQYKDTPIGSPVPDNRASTPVPGSRAASASLPANINKASELKQRLAQLEAMLPSLLGPEDKIATQEWVKAEIEGAHEASDEFVAKEMDALKTRVDTNERNIGGMGRLVGGIEDNVQHIITFNKTMSSLPGQIDALRRSHTTPPAGENTAAVEKSVEQAVAKSISAFDQKHTANLTMVQQGLQSFHEQLYRQDGGVFIRIDGLTVALTNLDARVSKINTLDLHQSMVHQFHQEQFPQLQNLPNLESQAQATAERVSALEKVTKDPPLSELRDVQEANQTLSDKVNSLESRTSNHNTRISTLETRNGKESEPKVQKDMRTEMDRNTHDLAKLNSKMKNDFQPVVPRVIQLEDAMEKVRADLLEVKTDVLEVRAETEDNRKDTQKFKESVADKIADLKIDMRNSAKPAPSAARSAPSTSPFNNNPNNSIRDRKTSTPVANGTIKKRKLENGHSAHSSFSSNSRTNGASRGSSIDHNKKSKRRRRNPEEDEDDDDYEEVRQPALLDSDSEEEDD